MCSPKTGPGATRISEPDREASAVSLHIERTSRDALALDARIEPKDDDGSFRATLLSGDREIASYAMRDNAATFDDIGFGEYVLRITSGGGGSGELALSLKREGA